MGRAILQFIWYWVFRFEAWFVVLSLTTILVGIIAKDWVFKHETLSAGIVGAVYATWFSFVNYRISKDKLFKELFKELNARYDAMNEDLNAIFRTGQPRECVENEDSKKSTKEIVIDYLILCSEEYLWYRKRRIPSEVWSNWKEGILYFISNKHFKEVYDAERNQSNSYYGLFEEMDRKNKIKNKSMKSINRILLNFGVPLGLGILLLTFWQLPFRSLPKKMVKIYSDSFIPKSIQPSTGRRSPDSLNARYESKESTLTETGPIGDTFGGTVGPIIAIAAAYLTFIAFWAQFVANLQQRRDIALERFENRFYEYIRLHRANVDGMEIARKINGRKCFVFMYKELERVVRATYAIKDSWEKASRKIPDNLDLMDFSYKLFFFGIGGKSKKLITSKLDANGLEFYEDVIRNGLKIADADKRNDNLDNYEVDLTDPTPLKEVDILYFGHAHRLGHYYRHLFQAVRFVVESDIAGDRRKRYGYLKILRAQLSNHEHLLLYYNSFCTFGSEWISKGYFTDYRFIKNLPIQYADFGVKPLDYFVDQPGIITGQGGILYNRFNEVLFEWEET